MSTENRLFLNEKQAFFALKRFFALSQNALFLANQANQSFTFFNDHFANFFSENNTLEESIAFEKLYAIAHEDDRHLLHKLLASSIDQSLVNEDGENIRFFCKKGICRVFNLRCTKLADAADDYSITGILTDVTDLLWFEQQQKKSDKTFRELSFITSHELRHEYAKIQSIIQMLDNVLISENERNEMIAASRQSIQVINSTIFKINHKLSFNQTDGYFDFYKKNHQYKKIILIDDDGLTNTINKRIIQLVNNTIEVVVFTDIEAAETFLITADQSGEYLILLDVNFPFSSGWEFLENYQQFHIQSKVIVLSSSIDTYDRDKARKYPMVVDYITKPLSLEMVKEMLYA
jgi:CheY-like chemotaxis protein